MDVRFGGGPVQEFAFFGTSGRGFEQIGVVMARKSKSEGKRSGRMLPVLHPDAAGIDIGAEEIFVAVPPDQAAEPVQSFGTFHVRSTRASRLARGVSDPHRGCGINWRLLDSALPSSGDARL